MRAWSLAEMRRAVKDRLSSSQEKEDTQDEELVSGIIPLLVSSSGAGHCRAAGEEMRLPGRLREHP